MTGNPLVKADPIRKTSGKAGSRPTGLRSISLMTRSHFVRSPISLISISLGRFHSHVCTDSPLGICTPSCIVKLNTRMPTRRRFNMRCRKRRVRGAVSGGMRIVGTAAMDDRSCWGQPAGIESDGVHFELHARRRPPPVDFCARANNKCYRRGHCVHLFSLAAKCALRGREHPNLHGCSDIFFIYSKGAPTSYRFKEGHKSHSKPSWTTSLGARPWFLP